jgi:homoserine O-acetyltransferase
MANQPLKNLPDNTISSQPVELVERQTLTLFDDKNPLKLESGRFIGPIDVAYETYGQLSGERDNAILILHALSGDAHVTGRNQSDDPKPGWWDIMVGPGKAFDTNRYFVICSNCLGGCTGTTGPSSINPQTQKPYGLSFPMITIGDLVEVQRRLIDHLGIDRLLAVAGGSMGGMQALEWATRYPDRVAASIPIATTTRLSAQSIAFDAVGRNAILRDEKFQDGNYYENEQYPRKGLAIARMIGHITYLSEEAMHEKFGRRLQKFRDYQYDFDSEFSVETYLDHQGSRFVDRFDANTYLYFSKAMDYFDLARRYGDLNQAMSQTTGRFLVISFDSDWLFPPAQSQEIVNALIASRKDVSYCNIHCPYGHDSFLLETQTQAPLISGFLRETYQHIQKTQSAVPDKKETESTTQKKNRGSIFSGKRVDHRQIENLIQPDSRVLDLGCGDGQLLQRLQDQKNIIGMGLTLNESDITDCVGRGVSVIQFDLDDYLSRFQDGSYDYVVLSQTLQVVSRPEVVLREMLRIGREAIVSFPNFAYWPYRLQMLFTGRAPIGKALPHTWYDKESTNYLSISDFEDFARDQLSANVITRIPLASKNGRKVSFCPNALADEVIFVISKETT